MKYFAIINDNQCGPYELDQLVDAGVRPDTYVWCKGMTDWRQAREVADICRFFRIRIFDLMHPSSAPVQDITPQNDTPSEPETFRDALAQMREVDVTSSQESQNTDLPPRTWLTEAIVLTILCFPITGLVAIFHSHKAAKLWNENRRQESYKAARKAKMWCLYTICFGVLIYSISSNLLSN